LQVNLLIPYIRNGCVIAKIYNKYNQLINFEKINELLQEHLSTTLAEATTIINNECQTMISLGEVALTHIREIADYLNSRF
jgi:hypothetical protein